MKVLVTGHKGYIGTVLTPLLTAAGHEVHGLDSDLFSRCTYGTAEPAVPETIKDVRDAEPGDVEGFDVVNFGSTDAGTVISLATGARVLLGDHAMLGLALEAPITSREDVTNWRAYADLVLFL